MTGVSGSGKSSLAFDTLYEEGKRRYLMFSGTLFMVDSTPSFDSMTGLSPAVAVEQRIIRQSNPRITVGTRTKISNMLAMLFAAYGVRDSKYEDGIPLAMEMFQKNSPKGMCVKCLGNGIIKKLDEEKLFEDLSQKIEDICLGLGKRGNTKQMLNSFCKYHNISSVQKLSTLTDEQLFFLKYGDNGKSSFMGFVPWITHITNGALSTSGRLEYLLTNAGYMSKASCPKCSGTGLGEQASHTTIGGKTISELGNMYIKDLCQFLTATPVTQPTIGLHELEKAKLIDILKNLVSRGNTVIAVEHDENFMRSADYIIDLGPNAGIFGGELIFQGSFAEFLHCKNSNTSPYLRSKNA